MAKRGKIQEIADACGVNQATVRRALAAANLSAGRGGYDFDKAVEIVGAHADPARIAGHASSGRGEGGNGDVKTFSDIRAVSEGHRARKLELDNLKAEGRLIDRETVTETGISIIAAARTALLSLGHRTAAKVAGKTDIAEIARLIETEVRDVLGVLADDDKFLAALEAEVLS